MNLTASCSLLVSLLLLWVPAATSLPKAPRVVATATEEELPVVAAWSPDGQRLAYGTEKKLRRKRPPLAADEDKVFSYPGEVWVTGLKSKPKRILKYNFLRNRVGDFFSFTVERLAWSPDGTKLAVEVADEEKNTATFLLTANGKKVKVGSRGTNYVPAYGAAWLGDNQSLGLLTEAVPPRLLHRVHLLRITAGRNISLFRQRTFAAVAWLPQRQQAVLVERDLEFARPPRLMLGDLKSGELQLLDELSEGYLGGLRASPDETKVSYFVGHKKLAVRGLAPDAPADYWPIPFGRYEWVGATGTLLFLEPKALGARTGWLTRYDPGQKTTERVLPDELIQDFWVAPTGDRVAVLTAGLKPTLKIYPLEAASSGP
ncbi:MAG: hypothetical protein ACE5HL_00140 [Terriglobia bacterium]